MIKKIVKSVRLFFGIVIIIGILYSTFKYQLYPSYVVYKPIPIDFSKTYNINGTVSVINTGVITAIRPQIIKTNGYKTGQIIKKGSMIFSVENFDNSMEPDTTNLKINLQDVNYQIKDVIRQIEDYKDELITKTQLYNKGAISSEDVKVVESKIEQLQLLLENYYAKYRILNTELKKKPQQKNVLFSSSDFENINNIIVAKKDLIITNIIEKNRAVYTNEVIFEYGILTKSNVGIEVKFIPDEYRILENADSIYCDDIQPYNLIELKNQRNLLSFQRIYQSEDIEFDEIGESKNIVFRKIFNREKAIPRSSIIAKAGLYEGGKVFYYYLSINESDSDIFTIRKMDTIITNIGDDFVCVRDLVDNDNFRVIIFPDEQLFDSKLVRIDEED